MVSRENYHLVKVHLKYLQEVEQLSAASLKRYWFWFRHLLLWAGETPLCKASGIRPAFPVYVSTLPGSQGAPSLAGIYQKKIIIAARRFFLWTRTMGYRGFVQIPFAWVDTLRPARLNSSTDEHIFVTLEETIQLATFQVNPQDLALRRDQAAAAMLFLSGVRNSAFTSLPIHAVDIKARCLYQWPELGVKTKNRKKATTFLLPISALMKVVEAWDEVVRTELPPTAPWYATIHNRWGEQKLMGNSPGENRNQMLIKRLRRLYAAAGLTYKSAHKFRHGHAVYGLQHAQTMADYKAVSMNLMHKDIKITDEIYAPILSNEVKDRIDRLTSQPTSQPDRGLVEALSQISNAELAQLIVLAAHRLST